MSGVLNDQEVVAIGNCCRCKCPIRLPIDLYKAAKHSPKISFWCAYGHEQRFVEGETAADKLRRERDLLKQRIAEKDDAIARLREWRKQEREQREAAERRASAARGQVTRIKNRAQAGVCPCCNRTFSQLARHMAAKHPTFAADDVTSPTPEASS